MLNPLLYNSVEKHSRGEFVIWYVWFEAMHSRLDIILCSDKEEEEMHLIFNRIYKEVMMLDKKLSRFDTASLISVINRTASLNPCEIDEELFHILQSCKRYGEKSYGNFDITIQSGIREQHLYREIELITHEQRKTAVYFRNPHIQIDLGGYAKGYTVKKLISVLKKEHIHTGYISFGESTIYAIGSHTSGYPWKTGIRNVYNPAQSVLELTHENNCINCSGNSPSHTSHIFSPALKKRKCNMGTIVILNNDPEEGEVLSTALFAAGEEAEYEILKQFTVQAAYRINYRANHVPVITNLIM